MADVEAPQLKVLQECGFKDQEQFGKRGAQALELLRGLGALEKGKLVELGCTGHVAAAVKPHAKELEYHGIGVNGAMLKWCGETLQGDGFKFQRLDVRDAIKNPGGAVLPEKVRLPFEEESVDTVYADSLFTTMGQDALRRYISEIARILKAGGRFVATFFLLDGSVMVRISQRRTRYSFEHRIDTYCRAQEKNRPGTPIAYNGSFIQMLGAPVRLAVKEIKPGSWSSHEGAVMFEDLLLAEKLPAEEEGAPAEEEQKAPEAPAPAPQKPEAKPEAQAAPQPAGDSVKPPAVV